MAIQTIYPDSFVKPVTAISSGSTGWNVIDLGTGQFTSIVSDQTVSVGFSAIDGTINAVSLKFDYVGDNNDFPSNSVPPIRVFVSLNGGSSFVQLEALLETNLILTSKIITVSNVSDLSLLEIGLWSFGTSVVADVRNLRLEVSVQADTFFQTVNALALELMAEYGDRNASAKKLGIVEKWINRVYQKIIAYYGWPFAKSNESFTTVQNTSSYTLLEASMQVSSMRHSTGEPIRYRSRDQLVRDQVDFSVTGKPRFFYHEGISNGALKVVLVPTPDAAYTITAYSKPLPIQLVSTDNVPLPTNLLPILLDGVRYYYSQADGHPDDAQAHLANFKSELRDLAHLYRIEPADDSHMQEVDVVDIDVRDGRFGDNFPSGIF